MRAYRSLGRFRRESSLKTWLYRIVMNLGLNHLRRTRAERTLSTPLEQVVLTEPALGLKDVLEREGRERLEQAIARLRQGISNLNREGRKRLLEAFEMVNGHFQRLFQTLFGGGSAEKHWMPVTGPGQVIEGGVVSLTVNVWIQVLTLPHPSMPW